MNAKITERELCTVGGLIVAALTNIKVNNGWDLSIDSINVRMISGEGVCFNLFGEQGCALAPDDFETVKALMNEYFNSQFIDLKVFNYPYPHLDGYTICFIERASDLEKF